MKQPIILGALVLGATVGLAPAGAYAVDYTGKKVSIIVPTKEGGGSDSFGRIFQPFLEKYLPGNPTVLVVNKPGGSGIKGGNWFELNAKRDGTALIVTGSSPLNSFLFAGEKVKYNLRKWRPIILSAFGTCFYAHKSVGVTGKDVVADIKKLRKAEGLLMGAKNPTSSEIRTFLAYDLLGITQAKPLFGLSSGQRRKATLRGETKLGMDSSLSCATKIQKFVKKGTINIYMTMGIIDEHDKIVRDPVLPNVPHVGEVYEKLNGKKPSGPMWDAYKHLLNLNIMAQKALWLPNGTPDEVYQTYLATMKKIFKDKKFKKQVEKTFAKYPQAFGKRAEKIIKDSLNFSPETMKWMKDWIDRRMVGST
jgi:tripartite-type tricarboxylate transporter receptor subunit TctC